MNKRISSLFFVLFLTLSSVFTYAQQEVEAKTPETLEQKIVEDNQKFDAKGMIMSHISDSNEWHVFTLNEGTPEEYHFSIPLPIIIKDKNGLHMMMSSALAHGHEHDGYTLDHGIVTSTQGLEQAKLFSVMSGKHNLDNAFYDFSITKNVAAIFISIFFMLLVFIGMARGYAKSLVPSGFGRFMEPVILFIRDEVAIPNIGAKKYKKYMPYLLTVFFFIWFNNMFGLIPFAPFGYNLTGNIATTAVLAIITLLITIFSANKDYWKHIFMPPVPLLLYPIMVPIEIIGIFTKPFALMMRLFANITAGHIMVLAIMSLIFIFKTPLLGFASVPLGLFIGVLELLVAALQAYIFTVLSALFIGIAVAEHDHEGAH